MIWLENTQAICEQSAGEAFSCWLAADAGLASFSFTPVFVLQGLYAAPPIVLIPLCGLIVNLVTQLFRLSWVLQNVTSPLLKLTTFFQSVRRYPTMATTAVMAHQPNPVHQLICDNTKALTESCRYINGAIVTFLVALFAGEKHISPEVHISATEWHRFLWIVWGAIFALLLDRAQMLNNLLLAKLKNVHIDSGMIDRLVFGKKELRFRLSWWIFYTKLAVTLLNVAASIALLGPIVSRLVP
jgi:hypothetical protein